MGDSESISDFDDSVTPVCQAQTVAQTVILNVHNGAPNSTVPLQPSLEAHKRNSQSVSNPSSFPKCRLLKNSGTGEIEVELDFNVVILGEIRAGKSSLVQALCREEDRKKVPVAVAAGGVTKQIASYRIREEILENAWVIDSPGAGDKDFSICELVDALIEFYRQVKISCVILACDTSDDGCKIGGRLAGKILEASLVNSHEHIIICGTKADRWKKRQRKKREKQWRRDIAKAINDDNFEGNIEHICVTALEVDFDSDDESAMKGEIVDLESEETDIQELIDCMRKVKDLNKYATTQAPNIKSLVNDIAKIIGAELTTNQKEEIKSIMNDAMSDQEKRILAQAKEMINDELNKNMGTLVVTLTGPSDIIISCDISPWRGGTGLYHVDKVSKDSFAYAQGLRKGMVLISIDNSAVFHKADLCRVKKGPFPFQLTFQHSKECIWDEEKTAAVLQTVFGLYMGDCFHSVNQADKLIGLIFQFSGNKIWLPISDQRVLKDLRNPGPCAIL